MLAEEWGRRLGEGPAGRWSLRNCAYIGYRWRLKGHEVRLPKSARQRDMGQVLKESGRTRGLVLRSVHIRCRSGTHELGLHGSSVEDTGDLKTPESVSSKRSIPTTQRTEATYSEEF